MLNSTRIDLATTEYKACGLDQWASLFKASTGEELKMLAKQGNCINEASATIYQLSQEENIRLQCEAREDYYRRQCSVQNMLREQKQIINQLTNENSALQRQLASALEQLSSLQGSDNNVIN